ncbi:DUF4179 domain-containing protein [Sporolactobacillus nakayamae]|uniref:DUF4179 domain-containing protein n=1 Tax=Sporolactobacillus nakayamae TaxID=269670 RepID=A0A1I2QT91_9BACL|nr:DUF4179 domain-containing protein [Sporolactobacillus nakayamae]SFG28851.1 protein of unknown function [Sporolactobacillus nakayamae]
MNKTSFKKETNKIDVPKDRVMNAIHQGIEEADVAPRKRHRKLTGGLVTSGAAAALIAFSFLSPSVSRVLAEVPILSAIYGRAYDSIGQNLSNQKLVTELNQSATDKGIKVTITSAYYDGASIGLTFKASGPIKVDDNGEQGKNFIAFYEIFGGDLKIDESQELAVTSVQGKRYTGHVQINYPQKELPKKATLPITFKEIGDKKGIWAFNVPIKQLPKETVKVSAESRSKDGKIKVRYESVVFAKSSTFINYQVILPDKLNQDYIELENIYDDQGREVQQLSDGHLEKFQKGNQSIINRRLTIPSSLKNKTKTLTVHPVNRINEQPQFVSPFEKLPVTVRSEKTNSAIRIEEMFIKNGHFTVIYQIDLGDKKNEWGIHFLKTAIKDDLLVVKKRNKNSNQNPMEHSVTVLDKDKLRFSSTFGASRADRINGDYLLRVSFNGLNNNLPEELSPATLSLDK